MAALPMAALPERLQFARSIPNHIERLLADYLYVRIGSRSLTGTKKLHADVLASLSSPPYFEWRDSMRVLS